MSIRNVKSIIKSLITDPDFQNAFFVNKDKALKASGLKFTPEEKRALRTIKRKDVKVKVIIKKGIAEGIPPVVLKIKPGGPKKKVHR